MAFDSWLDQIEERQRVQYARALDLLVTYVSEMSQSPKLPFKKTSLGRELDSCGREKHLPLARALLAAIVACRQAGDEATRDILLEALATLLRRRIALTEDDVTSLCSLLTTVGSSASQNRFLSVALDTIKRVMGSRDFSTEQRQVLVGLRGQLTQCDAKSQRSTAKLVDEIDRLCDELVTTRLHPDSGWADDLRLWLAGQEHRERGRWEASLRDAASVRPAPPAGDWRGSTEELPPGITLGSEMAEQAFCQLQLRRVPCPEWIERMTGHLSTLGRDRVAERVCHWLSKVPDSSPGMLARESLNREMLRGILYLCCQLPGLEITGAVARATKFLYRNNSPLGDTGVIVLHQIANRASLAALAAVGQAVTAKVQLDLVRFARTEVAERLGLDPNDLGDEEIPTLGFTGLGELRNEFGGIQARLTITGARSPELVWSKEGGKILNSIPTSVKPYFPHIRRCFSPNFFLRP
jgi:hypothetical protein